MKELLKELGFEHLAPYLPYGLKGTIGATGNPIVTLKGGDLDRIKKNESTFKPILRPLSDLTKTTLEILFNEAIKSENKPEYTNFISGEETTLTVTYKMMGDVFTDFIINRNSIELTDYQYCRMLFKNHFDVFGLIDKGLAININEL